MAKRSRLNVWPNYGPFMYRLGVAVGRLRFQFRLWRHRNRPEVPTEYVDLKSFVTHVRINPELAEKIKNMAKR